MANAIDKENAKKTVAAVIELALSRISNQFASRAFDADNAITEGNRTGRGP